MVNELEKKLKCKFRKALRENAGGNVVDELLAILKEDYILLARVPLSCRDCFNYHQRKGWPSDFCVKKQEYIQDCNCAYNCDGFVSGKESARRSLAYVHSELTDEWIIE